MATFTTSIQNDILKLVIGMFKASVGGKYLQDFRDFVGAVPAGKDPVVELAKTLQTKAEFANVFPASQSNSQFQDAFLNYFSLQNNQEARAFISQKLAAGVGRGEVILDAVRALDAYTGQDAAIKAAQTFFTGKFNLAFAHSVNNNVQEMALSPLQAVLLPTTELPPVPIPSVAPSAAPPTAPAVEAPSGSGSPSAPSPAPTPVAPKTIIEGVLSAGPVIAGNQLEVSAFGNQGQLLGTTVVDAGGRYSLTIPLTYTGPILVRVFDKGTSPDYLDEATGQPKDLNTDIRAVSNIPFAGGTFQVNLNPLTELAVKTVGLQSGDGGTSQINLNNITPAQITAANTQVANAFGLTGVNLTGSNQANNQNSNPSLIVNADALQVFADWRILTARPSAADEAALPHAGFQPRQIALHHRHQQFDRAGAVVADQQHVAALTAARICAGLCEAFGAAVAGEALRSRRVARRDAGRIDPSRSLCPGRGHG